MKKRQWLSLMQPSLAGMALSRITCGAVTCCGLLHASHVAAHNNVFATTFVTINITVWHACDVPRHDSAA